MGEKENIMINSDGNVVEDLFTAVIFGDVELDKKTFKPSKDLIFRVDVERCADVIAKEGIESFRKLLIENFEVHTDNIILFNFRVKNVKNGELLP